MNQTCMCCGVECGDGWFWLIDNLCNCIQNYINNNSVDQVEAVQVKEKFGGLRFYINYSDDIVFGMIRLAENISYNICEECGSFEGKMAYAGYWIKTLCPKCVKNSDIYFYKKDEKSK